MEVHLEHFSCVAIAVSDFHCVEIHKNGILPGQTGINRKYQRRIQNPVTHLTWIFFCENS